MSDFTVLGIGTPFCSPGPKCPQSAPGLVLTQLCFGDYMPDDNFDPVGSTSSLVFLRHGSPDGDFWSLKWRCEDAALLVGRKGVLH